MTQHDTPSSHTTSGWAAHADRQRALAAWLAREDVLAAAVEDGRVVDIADLADPAHGEAGTEREAMIRAAYQRWTTTWEGVLHLRLELGDEPVAAIGVAQARAAEVRDAEWRAIVRLEGSDLLNDLVSRQRARVARATGLSETELDRAFAQAESRTSYVVPTRLRLRRMRKLRRAVLARRAV